MIENIWKDSVWFSIVSDHYQAYKFVDGLVKLCSITRLVQLIRETKMLNKTPDSFIKTFLLFNSKKHIRNTCMTNTPYRNYELSVQVCI